MSSSACRCAPMTSWVSRDRSAPGIELTGARADTRNVFGHFTLRHRPCPECGASVAVIEMDSHSCDPERRADYQLAQQLDDLERIEGELGVYLASARGRFELWYAERRRLMGF
jgi:hypothetical protein